MACFTWGSDCEPEMMVNVPRALIIGLTPIRVYRFSSGVPLLTGHIPAEEPADGAAANDKGAAAAAAESMPVDFRRLRRVRRLLRIWFSKVNFLSPEWLCFAGQGLANAAAYN